MGGCRAEAVSRYKSGGGEVEDAHEGLQVQLGQLVHGSVRGHVRGRTEQSRAAEQQRQAAAASKNLGGLTAGWRRAQLESPIRRSRRPSVARRAIALGRWHAVGLLATAAGLADGLGGRAVECPKRQRV